jgi:hypothetical protein
LVRPKGKGVVVQSRVLRVFVGWSCCDTREWRGGMEGGLRRVDCEEWRCGEWRSGEVGFDMVELRPCVGDTMDMMEVRACGVYPVVGMEYCERVE